jgi:hypothetical protein
LSTIIKDRLITAGIERATKGKPFTKEEQHLLFERGFLWERMVKEFCETEDWIKLQIEQSASHHFAAGVLELPQNSLLRPGECQLDGIYMTPDAIHITDFRVEEWKATAMRAKNFDIEQRRPEWLWQAAAYANIFGMTKAMFRIWHVSENVISSLLVEWEKDEVVEEWRRIKDHYQTMKERNGRNRKV